MSWKTQNKATIAQGGSVSNKSRRHMLHENDLQFYRDHDYLIVRDLFPKATVLAANSPE